MNTISEAATQYEKLCGNNEMYMEFDARSENEGFARVAVAAFMAYVNPTLEEAADVKTAISEAVTNSIIHGYENSPGRIRIYCRMEGDLLHVTVEDYGVGIEDIEEAMKPLFTTKPELERSGMGFAFMEAFMDELEVESAPGEGAKIHMKKKLGTGAWFQNED